MMAASTAHATLTRSTPTRRATNPAPSSRRWASGARFETGSVRVAEPPRRPDVDTWGGVSAEMLSAGLIALALGGAWGLSAPRGEHRTRPVPDTSERQGNRPNLRSGGAMGS